MRIRIRFLLFLFLLSFSSLAQNYDKNYFESPLKIPIKLVGNFGEIRPNHFHSGIDLKVPYSGVKLYAAADGYVSRIKKSAVGYGNALYITHPNGLMTVYGHMQNFNKFLEKYSDSVQNSTNRFEFTVYPDSSQIKVKKGDLIGYAGNTGRSYGPHLHFEIREAEKDIPINPLLFNFGIKDNIRPRIFSVEVIPLERESKIFGNWKRHKIKLLKNGNTYYSNKLIKFQGDIGFAFQAYDYVNSSKNSQGIYSVKLFVDDSLIYSHKLDKISFYETRYLNSFIDYKERQISNKKYQKCFIEPGNKLSIYDHQVNRGTINFSDNKVHKVKIIVSDIKHNISIIKLKILGEKLPSSISNPAIVFNYDTDNYFVKDDFRAFLKKGCLYTDIEVSYSVSDSQKYKYSDIHRLNSHYIPIHENMHIAISTKKLPKKLVSKALIVYINKNNQIESLGGNYINGFIAAKSKNFGKFALAVDQIPPSIILENQSAGFNYSDRRKISLKIDDNLSGIKDYYGEIDGKPIIFVYDKKNDRISYKFDQKIEFKKKHTLKITVIDKKNNKSVFQTIFFK